MKNTGSGIFQCRRKDIILDHDCPWHNPFSEWLAVTIPLLQPTIERTQLALLIHAIAALILIAMAFGHIWMVLTVEGTIDAMKDGKVDENWAKSHHSRWYATASKSETAGTETTELEAGNSETNKEGAY